MLTALRTRIAFLSVHHLTSGNSLHSDWSTSGCLHCLHPSHANTPYPSHGFRIFLPSLSFILSFFCPQRQEKLMWIRKKEEFVLDNLRNIQDIFKRMIPHHRHMWICVFISFPPPLLPPSLRDFFFFFDSTQGHRESGRIMRC